MSPHSTSLGDFPESFWDQNSSVHDSSCPLYWSGLMACCFFLLQRWGLSPDRGIRIVILLRFCWIGVYCFDLCNDTYFFKWLHVPFSQGIWSDESLGAGIEGAGHWRRDLEWRWGGFWPSRPEIYTLVTEDILWLYRQTLQRWNGKLQLHVAGNEGIFQVWPSIVLTMISSIVVAWHTMSAWTIFLHFTASALKTTRGLSTGRGGILFRQMNSPGMQQKLSEGRHAAHRCFYHWDEVTVGRGHRKPSCRQKATTQHY